MGFTGASCHYVYEHTPAASFELLRVHIVLGDIGSPASFLIIVGFLCVLEHAGSAWVAENEKCVHD